MSKREAHSEDGTQPDPPSGAGTSEPDECYLCGEPFSRGVMVRQTYVPSNRGIEYFCHTRCYRERATFDQAMSFGKARRYPQ